MQPTGNSLWRHIQHDCEADCPRCRCVLLMLYIKRTNKQSKFIWWSSLKPLSRNSTRSRRRRHFEVFFRNNFRPGVVSDVICGTAVGCVSMDVRLNFGDYRSNRSRDIRAAQFVNDERRRPTDTVVEGQAKRRATKIRYKAVRARIFGRISNFDKCRPKVSADVISGTAV